MFPLALFRYNFSFWVRSSRAAGVSVYGRVEIIRPTSNFPDAFSFSCIVNTSWSLCQNLNLSNINSPSAISSYAKLFIYFTAPSGVRTVSLFIDDITFSQYGIPASLTELNKELIFMNGAELGAPSCVNEVGHSVRLANDIYNPSTGFDVRALFGGSTSVSTATYEMWFKLARPLATSNRLQTLMSLSSNNFSFVKMQIDPVHQTVNCSSDLSGSAIAGLPLTNELHYHLAACVFEVSGDPIDQVRLTLILDEYSRLSGTIPVSTVVDSCT